MCETIDRLSPRAREVLELLGDGLSNKELASRLAISFGRSKDLVAEVLHTLNVANRAEAAATWERCEHRERPNQAAG
ncbi:MAG: LuxR C-terminal-related transcriptional regulator [Dehalococcoidia bacterium]